ncbi:MAG TPA: TlpA disulfide reductase family protein [Acidimicrobiales bacterium]|nr:TlpA disulfide reductase family protein [Acidimicrobiales bacterium]
MSSSDTTEAPTPAPRPRRSRRAKVAIVAAAVAAAAAIGVTSALTGGSTGNNPPRSALIGQKVSDFSLPGLSGGVEPAPWESGRPSVLIFFASWCSPCQREMPRLAAYVATHVRAPVEVLGVDALDAAGAARRFVATDRVGFAVAYDPNGQVTNGDFGFATLPETVFVSARGVVTDVHFGAISNAQMAQGVTTLGSGS